MMYGDLNEEASRLRLKRAMSVKIKHDEWMLQTHPYVYRSCVTEEDEVFMKENYMCREYCQLISERKHFIPRTMTKFRDMKYLGWSTKAPFPKRKYRRAEFRAKFEKMIEQ